MKKYVFVAPGFEVRGAIIILSTPSPSLPSLVTSFVAGDGKNIVTRLQVDGHASAGDFEARMPYSSNVLHWIVKGDGWVHTVIVEEPLKSLLLDELDKI